MSFDQTKAILKSCHDNAEEHLAGARAAHAIKLHNIAYHLAALSLEEIGKTFLILTSLPDEAEDSDDNTLEKWEDDHIRKLFWALISPSILSRGMSGKMIEQYRQLARDIHYNRLEAIYVDATTGNRLPITQEQTENIIKLADSRLKMEQMSEYGEPDAQVKADLRWFQDAINDETLKKSFIFTSPSFDKLEKFGQDTRKWIRWIREQVDKWQAEGREELQKELLRQPPSEKEGGLPKWKIRVKLLCDSHSIRQGILNSWNAGVPFIQLTSTADKKGLYAELSLPKGVHVNGLWPAGMQMVGRFVVALNMGTFGLFWWYMPIHVSRYFEHITDLETEGRLTLDRNPTLKINWGKGRALKMEDFNKCSLVFSYMAQFNPNQLAAIDHYLRGLAMIAKTDIFVQFEPQALHAFFICFQTLARENGEWDGVEPFPDAAERILAPLYAQQPDIRKLVDLAASLPTKTERPEVNLSEVVTMKLMCDVYVVKRAIDHHAKMRSESHA